MQRVQSPPPPEPCKFRECVREKIDYYLIYDNPRPKTALQKISSVCLGHGATGRQSAFDFITQTWQKSGSEFILSAYEFIQSSGAGNTLRKRIGEGLCNAYGIKDAQIEAIVHDKILLYVSVPVGGGASIDHYKIYMEVIKTLLKAHIDQLELQKSFGNEL